MSEENNTPEPVTFDQFKASVPEEFRDNGFIAEAKDFPHFFSRIKDLTDYRGNAIRIPSEEAGQEQMQEFYDKLTSKVPGLVRIPGAEEEGRDAFMNNVYQQLGRPAEHTGYRAPEAPEGAELNAEQLAEFAEFAHGLGLSQTQFEALANRNLQQAQAAGDSAAQQLAANEAALKEAWGNAFEGRSKVVEAVIDKFFPSLKGAQLAELNPETAKELAALADSLNAEGGSVIDVNMGGSNDQRRTPDEAKATINDIRSNRDHPYHDKAKPGHADAVKMMNELYKDAYGSAPVGQGVSVNLTA